MKYYSPQVQQYQDHARRGRSRQSRGWGGQAALEAVVAMIVRTGVLSAHFASQGGMPLLLSWLAICDLFTLRMLYDLGSRPARAPTTS